MLGQAVSYLERAWKTVVWLSESFNPWWFLPTVLRTFITYVFSCVLFMGTGIAALLYINQVKAISVESGKPRFFFLGFSSFVDPLADVGPSSPLT
jgi:hypothetical protein